MAARETGLRGGRENATWSLPYRYTKVVLDVSRQFKGSKLLPIASYEHI